MKLTLCFLLVFTTTAFSAGFSQQVTIRAQKESLVTVIKRLRQQSDFAFVVDAEILRKAKPVTVDLRSTEMDEALRQIFQNQPLQYKIENKTIFVLEHVPQKLQTSHAVRPVTMVSDNGVEQQNEIKGVVVDVTGKPLAGATVRTKDGKQGAVANQHGQFVLKGVENGDRIIVQFLGYTSQELQVSSQNMIIRMRPTESTLDETQVIAYGTTSKRLNTGNVITVSGEDISRTPIMNPIAALEGRVPGMIVNQTSGVPGSTVKLQIRGRTQIDGTVGADENPLIIIDGVPMASGNENLNNLTSAISGVSLNGLSPFATINAGDIESIDVLKDADATAIYGSRGASGVIIITTKKGKAGGMSVNMRAVTGFSKAQKPDLLSTKDYLMMRREAFANDNKAMTNANAYDILLWDTTRNDLVDQLIGGTSAYSTIEGSMSGGTEFARFSVGGSYFRESDVYPNFTDLAPNKRANGYINASATSPNRKFTADFRGNYSFTNNQAPGTDLAFYLTLPPHYKLWNEDGSIAWNEGDIKTENPLAGLLKTYSAKTSNLMSNALMGYKVLESLELKASIGYNRTFTDEIRNTPLTAQNPLDTRSAMSQFGKTEFSSWIFEPQLHYKKNTKIGNFVGLFGGTIQYQRNDRMSFSIKDYPSDDFLGTLIGIPSGGFINPSSGDSEYKYTALFGRVSYNLNNSYLLNLSWRRDGSSRFGPNYRFSNFGALGAAWIFSNESFFKELNEIVSFGKLRASYGITGNDKIGDYKYRDLYSSDVWGPTYGGQLALSPTSLFKSDLHWERNKKLEVALDLGFIKDRIIFGAAWYRNRSNDPLVQYPLAYTSGFNTVTANLKDVVVQNQGLELTWSSKNFLRKDFEWRTSFNITLPSNKLVAYPDLENSSYANRYIIGRSLDLVYIGNFLGVDPTTGLYQVEDLNGSGKFEVTNLNGDLSPNFDTEPSFYGGMQNDFRYKNFALSLFFNFTKQWTQNWRTIPQNDPVGGIKNMPTYVLRRWQKEGDMTDVQRFTTNSSSSNSLTGNYASSSSDAKWDNIFYARLRTVELMYRLPNTWIKKSGVKQMNVFMQGQNLFTFSPFRGNDPQTVFINRLAPLRTYVFGLQLSL
ncbi:SusC/RagA family TonB-linked outer membrane protein [Sphingobacterium nematocida]|nr:SusC/RagA family TonB-linked outer membrane protein [Sphingobacterium nematocida]